MESARLTRNGVKGKDVDTLFAGKFDFLMRVVGAKNSVVAKALSFDPSYISRVRAGKRGISGQRDFVEGAADFFARNACNDFQRSVIFDAIDAQPESTDVADVARLIADWLTDGSPFDVDVRHDAARSVDGRLREVDSLRSHSDKSSSGNGGNVTLLYGDDGKRKAVETFLSDLIAGGKPASLLLYSDEDMRWLTEDEAFAGRWAAMLLHLLKTGSTIKIVHTVSRDIGDMIEGMKKWIPLYAVGKIEPFYCPKIRDGIFRRTLFVAEGTSVVNASSCGNPHSAACLYIRDERAAKAFAEEFLGFFALCDSLGKAYTPQDASSLMGEVSSLAQKSGKIVLAGASPLFATIPDALLQEGGAQLADPAVVRFLHRTRAWVREFLDSGGQIVDIVNASPGASDADVPLTRVAGMLGKLDLRYSAAIHAAHVEAAWEFASAHENYQVAFCGDLPANVSFFVSESGGAIVSFAPPWCMSLALGEQRMVRALVDYLERAALMPRLVSPVR